MYTESGTKWGRLRGERHGVQCPAEAARMAVLSAAVVRGWRLAEVEALVSGSGGQPADWGASRGCMTGPQSLAGWPGPFPSNGEKPSASPRGGKMCADGTQATLDHAPRQANRSPQRSRRAGQIGGGCAASGTGRQPGRGPRARGHQRQRTRPMASASFRGPGAQFSVPFAKRLGTVHLMPDELLFDDDCDDED